MRIAILGAGAWGSALSISFAARHPVTLWARSAQDCERLERERASAYLPGCSLPEGVRVEPDLAVAAKGAELVIVATATAGLRPVAQALAAGGSRTPLLWACKGFEQRTRRLSHEIVAECLPGLREVGALSGPSFALEVARGQPTALVLASEDGGFAGATTAALNSPRLRLYSSRDVRGVELGGAVKNVIAIAAGISDGLELGRNARAALITRGLAEMVRLGAAMGGQAETFMGLAGLGDLVLTCTGEMATLCLRHMIPVFCIVSGRGSIDDHKVYQEVQGRRTIPLLQASRASFPFVELAFADSAYGAQRVKDATSIAIEIVKKIAGQVGFQVLPRRWVVERFFAWINRNRRLAKDFEATIASAQAFLYAASVMLLTRRLARSA